MGLVHSFVSFIPSTFLGVPEESTSLGVLPAHKLLMKGRGYEAVWLATLGGFLTSICAIVFFPVILLFSGLYPFVEYIIPALLFLILLSMLYTERKSLHSAVVILLSGLLGYLCLSLSSGMIFPLLAGAFGLSSIIISLGSKSRVPIQNKVVLKEKISKSVPFVSFFSSFLVAFLPGVSSSIAALLSRLFKKFTDREYLVLLGGINTCVTFLSVISVYLIGRARSGLAIAVRDYASPDFFILSIPLFLISVSFGTFSTLILARFVSGKINKIKYASMNYFALFFTILLVFLLTGWLGLLVLTTSTALGLITALFGVKRINCMASLIIPTLLVLL